MQYTNFNTTLTILSGGDVNKEIAGLSDGDLFLFPDQAWQLGDYGPSKALQGKGTERRHKIHYQRRVVGVTPSAGPGAGVEKDYDANGITVPACGYTPEYDILESDIVADETKTVTRVGKDKLTDTISEFPAGPNKFSSVGQPPLKSDPGEGFRGTGTSSGTSNDDKRGDNTQDGPNSSRDDDARHDVHDPIGKWS